MDSATLLGTVAGGGLGYLAGVERGKKLAPDNSNEDVNTLANQVLLLKTQIEAQKALITALSSQSDLADNVKQQLLDAVKTLEDKLAGTQVNIAGKFPVIIGSGDPAQAGWIKGRDGMLINRVLPNFISADSMISVMTGFDLTAPTTSMAISDVNNSLPARSVTIGQSMNTSLKVRFRKGIFGSMCAVLNFVEDVADDTDFVSFGSVYDSLGMNVMCVPIGRNSLMLMPLTPAWLPSGYSSQSWYSNILRDVSGGAGDAVITNPTAAQRTSFGASNMVLQLSHRTARNLTLRSWNIVGHPFALWQETVNQALDAKSLTWTRRQGATTVVQRHNTSVTPKFYRPNELGDYDSVDLASSSYL